MRCSTTGRVGALFPTGDVAALGDALSALLDDPARRAGAVQRAASDWVRRYDWDTVDDDLLAVYETVAAGLRRRSARTSDAPLLAARPSPRPRVAAGLTLPVPWRGVYGRESRINAQVGP